MKDKTKSGGVFPLGLSFLLATALILSWFSSRSHAMILKPTPLSEAVQIGDVDGVKKLLQQGADPNFRLNYGTWLTVMHLAAEDFDTSILALLIEHGGDVNAEHLNGTPLTIAIKKKNLNAARLLLEKGARPDTDKKLSLQYVGYHNDKNAGDWVKLLLAHGAKVNPRSKKRLSGDNPPLANAIFAKNYQCIEILLAAGANVNDMAVGQVYEEPLIFFSPDSRVLTMLIKAGADVNARMHTGDTCLHEFNAEMSKILLDNGANPNLKNKDKNSPLHLAMALGPISFGFPVNNDNLPKKILLLMLAGADLDMVGGRNITPRQLLNNNKDIRNAITDVVF